MADSTIETEVKQVGIALDPGATTNATTTAQCAGWIVAVDWEMIGGRMEPVTVTIHGEPKRSVTGLAIRQLPWGAVFDDARQAMRERSDRARQMHDRAGFSSHEIAESLESGVPIYRWPTEDDAPGDDYMRQQLTRVSGSGPRRGRRLTDDDLAAVAAVYREAYAIGRPVNEAVRTAFFLSKDGAVKRIGAARRAGLLDDVGPKR